VVGLLEDAPRNLVFIVEVPSHPDLLRALAREDYRVYGSRFRQGCPLLKIKAYLSPETRGAAI
ncbi:MAG: hypothetical protein LBQ56_00725, partial [Synergistaceae bacterium]|nr:hypothetical protein [Synergistaceae bacterium]